MSVLSEFRESAVQVGNRTEWTPFALALSGLREDDRASRTASCSDLTADEWFVVR
jgi:hypothetical protein